jgi:hypothetical protein
MRTRGAPVVERAHKGLRERQRQDRIAQQPETGAGRGLQAEARVVA